MSLCLPEVIDVCRPHITSHTLKGGGSFLAVSREGISALAAAHSLTVRESMVTLLRHDIWPLRFLRNAGVLFASEQASLLERKAAIIGCGGLGGYVASLAARVGFGSLLVCDGDTFQESNLNRQLFCTEETLGCNKAEVAGREVAKAAFHMDITVIPSFATEENLSGILRGATVVFDCLDNIAARLVLEKAAHAAGASFIHGALSGLEGMAGVSRKKNPLMAALYGDEHHAGSGFDSAPPITPPLVAAVQVYLAAYLVTGKVLTEDTFWHLDFSQPAWDVFSL